MFSINCQDIHKRYPKKILSFIHESNKKKVIKKCWCYSFEIECVVVSGSQAGLFVTWFAGTMCSETRNCIPRQTSVGYPRNGDTYKYPNIMVLCA